MSATSLLRSRRRALAGLVSAVAVAGAVAGCGSTAASTGTSTAAAATATPPSTAGAPPAMGQPVTGTAAAKAKAAALAKYKGTVEQIMQLDDGSYVVHVIQSSGTEVHVAVSKDFTVTGTQQGGPPAGDGTPPAGAPATGAAA